MAGRRESEARDQRLFGGKLRTRRWLIAPLPSPHQPGPKRWAAWHRVGNNQRFDQIRSVDREAHRDLAAHRMPYQHYALSQMIADEPGEVVEIRRKPIARSPLAAAMTAEIEREHPAAFDQARRYLVPPMAMGGAAMAQHDRA